MSAADPQVLLVPTTTHGRVLVQRPAAPPAGFLLGCHGYGQSGAEFLDSLLAIPGSERWLVASVQGLHRFYARRDDRVVASWMTREDRESAIADNIAYLDAVVDALVAAHGPPRRLVHAGFSQGVAMAFRAAARGRRPADALLAGGGDVPPELLRSPPVRWPRVLYATGSADPAFPPSRLEEEAAALRALGAEVRTLVFEGGHAWAPALCEAAGELLAGLA